MTSREKVIFELNTTQGSRIKKIASHPLKDWVGIINENNTFSLWNYQQKILIKSFSCNTLDDNKVVQIKQVVFFDRHSLCTAQDCKNMKNNIIFVTNSKLIFYNYITDEIKQTTEKDLDQKIIRKVCVYSQTKICIALSDGSFKVLDTKDSQAKGSLPIRTVRGYHNKPITWIFAYSQNYNEMPRVITASDQDGMMACWNIDMILKSANNEFATPCFKFQSASKKSKQSISNEQIISLQYDPSSYRIITVNESYIRLWSTMTGMEVKRIKNTYKYREVFFFNHFTYNSQTFVAHSKHSKLVMIRNDGGSISVNHQIELKNFFSATFYQNQNQQFNITSTYTLSHHPSNLFIVTNFNMAIMELDKFYTCPYGSHHSFITKLSTINSRQYINKAQGQIRKNITFQQVNNIKFEDDILINTFFLSVEEDSIMFNLLEIQYSTMLNETRRYKIHKINEASPLRHSQGRRSVVMVNFEGNQIIIFNKILCYYEIYASFNEQEAYDILGNSFDVPNRIDFFSKFQLIGSGYCRDIVYHQFKNQFAIIAGFDQGDNIVEYKISKQKKGLFKGKQTQKIILSGEAVKYKIHIYQRNGKKYSLIEKTDYFISKTYRIYSFASFFAYSCTKGSFQLLQIVSQKNSFKEVQGILNSPEQVYVSYCQSYNILSYDKYFVVFKMQENGSMAYFRTFQHTILHGYFWEKFFFFVTERSLYFMHILNEDTIVIKVGDISTLNMIQKVIEDVEDDDFQPDYQLLPPGQLQIIGLINMSLVLLNQAGNPSLISLDKFPYIVFCLQISSGTTQQSASLYKRASQNISQTMRQALTNYGMIAPDLFS